MEGGNCVAFLSKEFNISLIPCLFTCTRLKKKTKKKLLASDCHANEVTTRDDGDTGSLYSAPYVQLDIQTAQIC